MFCFVSRKLLRQISAASEPNVKVGSHEGFACCSVDCQRFLIVVIPFICRDNNVARADFSVLVLRTGAAYHLVTSCLSNSVYTRLNLLVFLKSSRKRHLVVRGKGESIFKPNFCSAFRVSYIVT